MREQRKKGRKEEKRMGIGGGTEARDVKRAGKGDTGKESAKIPVGHDFCPLLSDRIVECN